MGRFKPGHDAVATVRPDRNPLWYSVAPNRESRTVRATRTVTIFRCRN
jgi:hypothetical protein